MGTRVTSSMLLRTALANVTRQRERLAITQEQASSGLRINRPSDDPVGVQTSLSLRAAQDAAGQFLRNADRAQGRLRAMEEALAGSEEAVREALKIAVQGANETLDAGDRAALALQVTSLHDSLLAQANARYTDGSLFAGFQNDGPAFSVSGPFVSGSPPPTVTFNGDSNEIQTVLEEGVTVSATLDGRRVFQGDADGDGLPDPGRENVFAALEDLYQALDNDDPVATRNLIDRLQRAEQQLVLERERVGAIEQRLEAARTSHEDALVDLEVRLSRNQDADTIAVLSDLVNHETALQASLEAAARIIQPSLLDFLG